MLQKLSHCLYPCNLYILIWSYHSLFTTASAYDSSPTLKWILVSTLIEIRLNLRLIEWHYNKFYKRITAQDPFALTGFSMLKIKATMAILPPQYKVLKTLDTSIIFCKWRKLQSFVTLNKNHKRFTLFWRTMTMFGMQEWAIIEWQLNPFTFSYLVIRKGVWKSILGIQTVGISIQFLEIRICILNHDNAIQPWLQHITFTNQNT